jgi:hypothetical protein
MHAYTCTCIYIYIYIYMYTHTHRHTYVRTNTNTCVYTNTYIHNYLNELRAYGVQFICKFAAKVSLLYPQDSKYSSLPTEIMLLGIRSEDTHEW